MTLSQGLNADQITRLALGSVVCRDVCEVRASSLVYEWATQLAALTGTNESKHGLGKPGSSDPKVDLSWMSMGFDRVTKSWSMEQRLNTLGIDEALRKKAQVLEAPLERCQGLLQKMRQTADSETMTSDDVLCWDMRISAVEMLCGWLRMISIGTALQGPLLGFVGDPALLV